MAVHFRRRPVTWFTTHPSELHHLCYDVDGDGRSDETLSGTAPHPFWLEAQRKFVPMGELKPGDVVTTANGGSATITANLRERAPPGETFTTHNFEVAEFHTYFVGAAGVWVHDTGSLWCDELVSRYQALLKIHPGETPYKTLTRVRDQILEKVDAKGTPLPKMPGEVASVQTRRRTLLPVRERFAVR